MRTIRYIQWIKKRGPFGIPYTGFKLRAAHVDEACWRRLRNRPFSICEMMRRDAPRDGMPDAPQAFPIGGRLARSEL